MEKKSARSLFFYMLMILIVPVIVLSCILMYFSIHERRSSVYESMVYQAEEVCDSLDSAFAQVSRHTVDMSTSTDFLYFSNQMDKRKNINRAKRILSNYSDLVFSTPEAAAILLYNISSDEMIFSSGAYYGFLRSYMYDYAQTLDLSAYGSKAYNSFHRIDINNHTYLLYLSARRYGIVMTAVDPLVNHRLRYFNKEQEKDRYLEILSEDNEESDFAYVTATDLAHIRLGIYMPSYFSFAYSEYWGIILTFTLIVLLIIVQIFFLSNMVLTPLNNLSEGIRHITGGELSHRLPESQKILEMHEMAATVNQMLDRVEEAQTAEFNSRMDAVQAKMQFLQIQIRPHFFLNCLKNMNSLLTLKKYDMAAELNYYLSDYIAYTFNDLRNFVPLRTELTSVKNYINLYNLLSYNIDLRFKLQGTSAGVRCLPMTILTFVENSIKHTRNLESFMIQITTDIQSRENGERFLRTLIEDNGGGFPEAFLEEFNRTDSSRIVYKPRQIGISNVRYRLWLIYGEKASLRLFNEGDHACVEIIHPYETEEGGITFESVNRR